MFDRRTTPKWLVHHLRWTVPIGCAVGLVCMLNLALGVMHVSARPHTITLPSGFVTEVVVPNLSEATAIAFAPD